MSILVRAAVLVFSLCFAVVARAQTLTVSTTETVKTPAASPSEEMLERAHIARLDAHYRKHVLAYTNTLEACSACQEELERARAAVERHMRIMATLATLVPAHADALGVPEPPELAVLALLPEHSVRIAFERTALLLGMAVENAMGAQATCALIGEEQERLRGELTATVREWMRSALTLASVRTTTLVPQPPIATAWYEPDPWRSGASCEIPPYSLLPAFLR